MSSTSNKLIVSKSQENNPVLRLIRNVQWEFCQQPIIPDYIVGTTSCVLYLSVRYHLLHPPYILRKIKELRQSFEHRILLVHFDVDDKNILPLKDLNKFCFSNDLILILAWTELEAARYIETLKAYESKPASAIQEREETEFLPKASNILTTVRSINKTDVLTLFEVFGSFKGICSANEQQLLLCPGLGEKKVNKLYQALHTPFTKKQKKNIGEKDTLDDVNCSTTAVTSEATTTIVHESTSLLPGNVSSSIVTSSFLTFNTITNNSLMFCLGDFDKSNWSDMDTVVAVIGPEAVDLATTIS